MERDDRLRATKEKKNQKMKRSKLESGNFKFGALEAISAYNAPHDRSFTLVNVTFG